jgi:hypothetical protein
VKKRPLAAKVLSDFWKVRFLSECPACAVLLSHGFESSIPLK